ncbi:MAG: phenylalanine--tRNA ligase subunit beta [Phycisphaerales bacterium]
MRTSVTWLNDYLDPPAAAHEQAELLTNAGFPLDGAGVADNGEPWQEIEITSNRGDCLCHVGFAREICAVSGRRLKLPPVRVQAGSTKASDVARVTNERPDLCPLYTARIVRGVSARPSPEWLQRRLVAIGLVPRNNLVDATNFVQFELGQPTHIFDLATLAGSEIRVRLAKKDEPFLPIGEGAAEVKLRANDLVIADRDRAVAIAGVKGGALTAVRDATRDILIEAATFDPVSVRATSRALKIASDSSYRFERGVHAAEVNAAAERLTALVLELAGGELCDGVLSAGAAIPAPRRVSMRPARCRAILGIELSTEEMTRRLAALGFEPSLSRAGAEERLDCVVPPRRLDVEREIDLIEEVCRTHGLDAIGVADTIPIRVAPIQPTVAARKATKDLLVGLGFVECVTHTLVSDANAAPFAPAGCSTLSVDDERAGGEPTLRPSLAPSLLRVRRHNLDNGIASLDLFECASTFVLKGDEHRETPVVSILVDAASAAPDARHDCYRRARGTVERVARLLAGSDARVDVVADASPSASSWRDPSGRVTIDGKDVGSIGLVSPAVLKHFGLEKSVAIAELALEPFFRGYPPETRAAAMPAFPASDRDVSAIVDEHVTWNELVAVVESLKLAHLESVAHVATYRGKQTGQGKKSVTMRLVFRAPDRTLKHEETEAAMTSVIATLRDRLGADLRTAGA